MCHVHSTDTLFTRNLHARYTLRLRYVNTTSTLSTRCPHATNAPYVRCLHVSYTLRTLYVHATCALLTRNVHAGGRSCSKSVRRETVHERLDSSLSCKVGTHA
eukprot:6182505-Pleurochrysis_carterae.AAC.1